MMPASPFSALAAFPDHQAQDAEDLDENTPPKKIRRWSQADDSDMHDESNDGATHNNWRGEGPSWYTPVRRQHQPPQSQPKHSENIERYRKIASAEDFARMPSFGMWLGNSEEETAGDQKVVGISQKSNIQIDDLVTMFDDTKRSNDLSYRSYPQSPIEKLFANSSETS